MTVSRKTLLRFMWCLVVAGVVFCGCDLDDLDLTVVKHVAVGWDGNANGKIIRTSGHGMDWDDDDMYTLSNGQLLTGGLRDVACGTGGCFVAVGRVAQSYTANVQYSHDMGATWLAGNANVSGTNSTELHGVAFSEDSMLGETFVAVGDNGTLIRSINAGQYWVPASSSRVTANMKAVTWGFDRFVAVGDGGVIIRSFDSGQSWAEVNSGTTANLLGIAYGNGVFIVTGEGGTMLYSADGDDWQSGTSHTTVDMHDAAFGYDQDGVPVWVAVGRYGTVRFSLDNGVIWVNRLDASPTTRDLSGVIYAMAKFVAVGSGVTLWTLDGRDWSIGTEFGAYHHLRGIARP